MIKLDDGRFTDGDVFHSETSDWIYIICGDADLASKMTGKKIVDLNKPVMVSIDNDGRCYPCHCHYQDELYLPEYNDLENWWSSMQLVYLGNCHKD